MFLTLGGGSTLGRTIDGWLSVLSLIPVIALLAAHATGLRPIARSAWPLIAWVGAVMLLAALHAGWTSDKLWWADTSRDLARVSLASVDLPVRGAWSLTPSSSWEFLLRWLGPAAILLALAGAGVRERKRSVAVVGIAAIVAALLTLVQQLVPQLETYRDANGVGIGWFANPNHHGLFLACGIVAALAAIPVRPPSAHRRPTGFEVVRPWIAIAGATLVIGMAVLLTGSRAALPLFLLGLGLALLARPKAHKSAWRSVALVALPVVAILALLLPRYVDLAFAGPSLADDKRWAAFPVIWDAMVDAMPWGTGFGSFDRVYLGIEPVALLDQSALNEAHNDLLQWLLEGGLAGLVLAAATAALLATRGLARLRDKSAPDRRTLLAGAIVVGLIALHSLIDYPMRTVALGALAMAGVSLWLIPPADGRSSPRKGAAVVTVSLAVLAALCVPFAHRPFDADAPSGPRLAEQAKEKALRGEDAIPLSRQAIAQSPLEASAFEALALAEPDWDRSNRFVDQGLALSKRAGVLPSLKLQRLLADQRYDEAVEQAVLLLRRQEPDPALMTAVRIAGRDAGFARNLASSLQPTHYWVAPLFALTPQSSDFEIDGMHDLLVALGERHPDLPPHLVEPTFEMMLERGDFAETAALHALLYPDRSALTALPQPNARSRGDTTRFDWRFDPRVTRQVVGEDERLEVRGGPRVEGPVGWRYLALRPGRYRISAHVTTSNQRAGVVPEVLCASGALLAAPTSIERGRIALDFLIDDGCPLAVLRLRAEPTMRSSRTVLDEWSIETLPSR